MRKPLSIYVHIPFCAHKCHYCAFSSGVAGDSVKEEYVTALKTEIKSRAEELSGRSEVKTVYIGGGTPSTLPDGKIAEILDTIFKYFVVSNDAEVTVEVNPSSLTPAKAKEYVNAGVTRVSMGLQAKQPHHLKTLGRLHTAEEFKTAVKILRTAGITNISGDIILGLPNQTLAEVTESVEFLADLNHISVYMLELEEGTAFKRLADAGQLKIPTDTETVKLYAQAKDTLKKLGFTRYEISNFARPGFESIHNQTYWKRENYLGLGASAHSFVDGTRFANTSETYEYISYLKDGKIPLEFKETLTDEEAMEEKLMLGLRTTAGVNLNDLGSAFISAKKGTIKSLVSDGFLTLDPVMNLTATDAGFMVLNKIIDLLI